MSDIVFLQEKAKHGCRQRTIDGGAIYNSGVLYHPAGYIYELPPEIDEDLQRFLNRPDLRAVLGHFSFGFHRRMKAPSRYISMVRNPVDRAISLYAFQKLVQQKEGSFWGITISDDMSIGEFVANPPYQELNNGQTRRIAGIWNSSISDKDLLSVAKANIRNYFAFVGITERFSESMVLLRLISEWQEWSFSYAKNTNPYRMSQSELSPDEIETIKAANRMDIELYQFAQEMFEFSIAGYGDEFQMRLGEYGENRARWVEGLEQA